VRCDPAARLLVTRWIDAPRVGRPLRSGATLVLVARALASLHGLATPRYLRHVRFDEQAGALERAFEPEAGDRPLRTQAREVFAALRTAAAAPVLCHHDLNPWNLLLDRGGRLWLVDWEYAGLGDARDRSRLVHEPARARGAAARGAARSLSARRPDPRRGALRPRALGVRLRPVGVVPRGARAAGSRPPRHGRARPCRPNNAAFANQRSTGGQWRRWW
jgi:hypothetical protein